MQNTNIMAWAAMLLLVAGCGGNAGGTAAAPVTTALHIETGGPAAPANGDAAEAGDNPDDMQPGAAHDHDHSRDGDAGGQGAAH